MSRAGISYADVVQAIVGLQQQGDNPTIQRIRDWLGTGSFTTISEHLKIWRQQQRQATPLQQAGQALPPGLLEVAQQLWQQACSEADNKLQELQQAATKEVEQAEAAQRTAEHAAQLVAQKNQLLEQKNTSLQAELQDLAAQVGHLTSSLEQSQASLEALRLASEQQINKLQSTLQQQQHEWEQRLSEQQQEAKINLEQEQQRNEANQLRWLHEVDLARQQAQQYKAAQQEAKQEAASIEQQLEAEKIQHLQLAHKLDHLKEQLQEAATKNINLEHKLESKLAEQAASWLDKIHASAQAFSADILAKNQELLELQAALRQLQPVTINQRPAPLILTV